MSQEYSRPAALPPRVIARRTRGRAGTVLLALLAGAFPAHAQRSGWELRLEPGWLRPYGQDQHVLTLHEVTQAPDLDRKTAVTLDARSGSTWRGQLRYGRGRWSWGAEFFYFDTSLEAPDLDRAAAGGGDQVVLEVADQQFTSAAPAQVVYYRLLADNDLAVWTFDLFGERTIASSGNGRLGLQAGLRFADFDNDYRAAAGVQDASGVRIDAASNYRRMTGPLLGMTGTLREGRITIEGVLSQSVAMGEVEFSNRSRQFTGPFGDDPAFVAEESISTTEKIAIPISELRIRGVVRLMDRVSLGAAVQTATWWDVGVPPGAIPAPGGDQVLHENTLVFFGVSGILTLQF